MHYRDGQGFRKSVRSNSQGNCVEVNPTENGVEVRNSRNPEGLVLTFNPAQWDAHLAEVANGGGFRQVDAGYELADPAGTRAVLVFTAAEVDAYRDGVRKGEFTRELVPA